MVSGTKRAIQFEKKPKWQPKLSIQNANRFFAESLGSEPAFVIQNKEISWSQFANKVKEKKLEISKFKGRKIILFLNNDIESIALLVASASQKGNFIIVSSYFGLEMAKNLMETLGCEFLLTPKMLGNDLQLNTENCKGAEKEIPTCFISILTSGTTGNPKVVKHSWESVSGSVKYHPKFLGRRWFLGFPVTHFGGLKVFLQCHLNGGTLVIPNDFHPKEGLKAIIKNSVDYLSCSPTYMRQLLAYHDTGLKKFSLRHITLGGEIVDQGLLDSIKKRIPGVKITQVYGSTELGNSIIVTDGQEGFEVGMLREKGLKIVNGELFVKKFAQSSIEISCSPNSGKDEWVGTGDLVTIEGTRVKFLGRKDDIINIGGFKVNPITIEQFIRSINGVVDVSIIPRSNPISGNIIQANLSIKEGKKREEVRKNVIQKCKEKLPYFMVPRIINFVENISVTVTQKKIRRGT